MAGTKSNKYEMMDRRNDVMQKLLQGHSTADIVRVISTHYKISKPTVEKDITYCYDKLREKYEKKYNDIPQIIAEHIAKYEQIRKMALEAYDFKSAIAALQSIEKLLKLHKDEPLIALQQNNMNINLNNLTLNELENLLSQSQSLRS